MCLILFAYRANPGVDLLVAANRDEFHGRASAAADFWQDTPQVLAGRDLEAGGTWLGCDLGGRFAALTNFSRPEDGPARSSRGRLVQDFLQGTADADTYAEQIDYAAYAGFNLLLFDGETLFYASNKADNQTLAPGVYGLSNAELGAEWPKCMLGASGLANLAARTYAAEPLLALLGDRRIPPDSELPQRGRDIELERRTASCFITGDEYGTRASTIVRISNSEVDFTEQLFAAGGAIGERNTYRFTRAG
ncbi:MAG: NRDE family protein [Pseudomonadota bacterium]